MTTTTGDLHRTKKSASFTLVQCPACGNKFKQLRGQPVSLPENCPICQSKDTEDAAAVDDTLVVNAKSLQRISGELQRQSAQIRRMESDIRSILAVLGKESTALNSDVPESTKAIPEPPQTSTN